jgi:hypothetical protein
MTASFRRFAGLCALLTAAGGITYSVTFAIYVRRGSHWAQWASDVTLLVGSLLALPVLLALYETVRRSEPQFALLALVLGLGGSLGAAVHGAYDVAVLSNPVATDPNAPNAVDARGFATFAVSGLALAAFGALALRSAALPRAIAGLGVTGGLLLVVVYFGRLILLDPNANLVKACALLSGIVLVPAFYLGVARVLLTAAPRSVVLPPQGEPAPQLARTAG